MRPAGPARPAGVGAGVGAATRARGRRGRRGFTLLELLAVATILGMAMMIVLPRVGATQGTILTNEARQLAAALEFTRQRAAMTGRPHRLLVAVDDGLYRVEWFVSDAEAETSAEDGGALGAAPWEDLDLSSGEPIPLSPPQTGWREYRSIPGQFGRDTWLPDGVVFAGVQTPEGWLDSGDVAVVFDRDGTTDAAEIEIADPDGRSMTLEISPLMDVVRIRGSSDDV